MVLPESAGGDLSCHLLQQSLYSLSQFLWFRRLEGACLGSSGLGSFVLWIRQWLGAGMAPLYEVPWPPTWTLHTASWGFLTAWLAVRLLTRGSQLQVRLLECTCWGTWCSWTCLLWLPWQSTQTGGWHGSTVFSPNPEGLSGLLAVFSLCLYMAFPLYMSVS